MGHSDGGTLLRCQFVCGRLGWAFLASFDGDWVELVLYLAFVELVTRLATCGSGQGAVEGRHMWGVWRGGGRDGWLRCGWATGHGNMGCM